MTPFKCLFFSVQDQLVATIIVECADAWDCERWIRSTLGANRQLHSAIFIPCSLLNDRYAAIVRIVGD